MSVPDAPANIKGAVASVAQQYGVPQGIWEDVAYAESGYNPNAVGDNGSSFGLFQLHLGGQANAALSQGYTTQQLLDPAINAKFGMPSIGRAWQALGPSFNANSTSWWQQFAAQSGHPGGSPGQAVTDSLAAKLQANYGGSASPCNPIVQNLFPYMPCEATTAADNKIAGAVSDPVGAASQAIFAPVLSAMPSVLIKAGVFSIALILIVAGLFLLVSQQS